MQINRACAWTRAKLDWRRGEGISSIFIDQDRAGGLVFDALDQRARFAGSRAETPRRRRVWKLQAPESHARPIDSILSSNAQQEGRDGSAALALPRCRSEAGGGAARRLERISVGELLAPALHQRLCAGSALTITTRSSKAFWRSACRRQKVFRRGWWCRTSTRRRTSRSRKAAGVERVRTASRQRRRDTVASEIAGSPASISFVNPSGPRRSITATRRRSRWWAARGRQKGVHRLTVFIKLKCVPSRSQRLSIAFGRIGNPAPPVFTRPAGCRCQSLGSLLCARFRRPAASPSAQTARYRHAALLRDDIISRVQ